MRNIYGSFPAHHFVKSGKDLCFCFRVQCCRRLIHNHKGGIFVNCPGYGKLLLFSTGKIDAAFIKAATEAGFVNLKGHRSVGGMRASIYNAMPLEGVEKLVAFMERFEKAL